MILIITSKQDGHVNAVARHFDAAGAQWARLNTEDFSTNVKLSIRPATGSGELILRDSGKAIDLTEVRAVWFRKPEPPVISHFALDQGALDYVEAELNEVLLGLYALLRKATWINDPFATRIAHRKMLQMHVAKQVGFDIPRSLITNDSDAALRFAADLNADLAIKSLSSISVVRPVGNTAAVQYGIFTRRVSAAELGRVKDHIASMPTLYQEFVEKVFELRVTVVGERIFACRIDHRSDDITAGDYRFDTANLTHTPWDCKSLHAQIRAYMKFFGLNFGCFDIIISKDGRAVFLECNPNGQWAWIENATALPIGQAIAEELIAAKNLDLNLCDQV